MVQMDLFSDFESLAPQPPLNGMYYERRTDRFVSFVLGRRHYEIPAKRCTFDKAWQEKTKQERAI
ncbi:hypothetical protein ABU162_04645 [Paenibacillus thiaminolyticus]|uniref:hypothetical protein n=1 Tax=Paenibacillus thiaminolyticus TaxID=49283 RepID=UPI0035A6C11B